MAAAEKPLSTGVIFGTSGLGGIMGWVCVHPFNTLAVRMNLATMGANAGPQLSFAEFSSKLIKNEGFMSLYNGLGAGCLRQVFYATSRYGLFEKFRDVCAQYRKTDFAQRFATASVAGGCAAVISCPVEVCLVRMSNDASLPVEQQRGYKSVFDAVVRIAKEDGLSAFYRGVQPFAMRAMLVGGTQVATYDQFKMTYAGFGITGLANQFCSSMSAGERWPSRATRHAPRTRTRTRHARARRRTRARTRANTRDTSLACTFARSPRRPDLLDRDDALRDCEEPDGLPEDGPRHEGDAVPRHLPDHRQGRGGRRRALPLVGLPALLRPLRGAHGDHVHLRRPDPLSLPQDLHEGQVRRRRADGSGPRPGHRATSCLAEQTAVSCFTSDSSSIVLRISVCRPHTSLSLCTPGVSAIHKIHVLAYIYDCCRR